MTNTETIAAGVAEVAARWLATSPGQPLTLSTDEAGNVSARIGAPVAARIRAQAAADMLGVAKSTFYSKGFFGLPRGGDGKFSTLQVERLQQQRAK